jgi:hypothetical protein
MCNHEPLNHPDGIYPDYKFCSQDVVCVAVRSNGQLHKIEDFRVCKHCGALYSEQVRLGTWKKEKPNEGP